MLLEYYKKALEIENIPVFLLKYLEVPSLLRLKKISYFCGMDYASKDIYNFSETITRYDHSLTVALMVYKLTHDRIMTLAGLFHDVATPCFSHVIDYMNGDYLNQESTEEYTDKIMKNDKYLLKCLTQDNIDIYEIVNFKNYSIVDNDRPKLCADRLDGVILTSIAWTKRITKSDIRDIINDIFVFKNEDNQFEIGFKSFEIANKVLDLSDEIDSYCHSKEDNYMMLLLAKITKIAIDKEYISYDNLYYLTEEEIFKSLLSVDDLELINYLNIFKNIKKQDIPRIKEPDIKKRVLNPLFNGKRLK